MIKIDNIHDNQYEVVLYVSDSCSGDIVGSAYNTNGCLPTDVAGLPKARSVRVIPKGSISKRSARSASQDMDLNMMSLRNTTFQSPISPHVFGTVDESDYDRVPSQCPEECGIPSGRAG